MKLAIAIGVSEYKGARNQLPACKNDITLVRQIIAAANKFDDILVIDCETVSGKVKTALAAFIDKHDGQQIEELLFYYTGHGDLHNDEFVYLFSDYEDKRRTQTSLANSELDAMFRSSKPKLTVKVVDACHSGASYVKDVEALSKSLEATTKNFEKCYFMFSSQKEQPSWQDLHLSAFTEAFGNAIVTHNQSDIRYKDIVDFISDQFQANTDQTPAFVAQANFTEVFCTISDALRAAAGAFSRSRGGPLVADTAVESDSATALLDRVKNDAGRYCDETEAATALETVRQVALDFDFRSQQLTDLYDWEVIVHDDPLDLPNAAAIARWLEDHGKKDERYFVDFKYKDEKYETEVEVPRKRGALYGVMRDLMDQEYDIRKVVRTRIRLSGYGSTAKLAFCAIEILAVPTYQNLPWWQGYLTCVLSKVRLRLFSAFFKLEERNWAERLPPSDVKWKTVGVAMKPIESVKESAANVFNDWAKVVVDDLEGRFMPRAEPERQGPDNSSPERAEPQESK
jgi:hypothetical protein